MLYLVHGSNPSGAHAKFQTLVSALRAKKPDALVVSLDEENASVDKLSELASSRDLFGDKYLVLCKRILANDEVASFIGDNAGVLEESENIFIFLEGELKSDLLDVFKESASKVQEVAKTKAEVMREESVGKAYASGLFAITDSLGRRDGRDLWARFVLALANGVNVEEIFWKLVWINKSMILAKTSGSAKEAEMKPYSFDKSKRFALNYKSGELETQSEHFLKMYHDNNSGGLPLDLAIERFILSS